MGNRDKLRSPAYGLTYAAVLPMLQKVARDHGYALAVHGSMQRDLDLIAVPWVEDAVDAQTLVEALRVAINGILRTEEEGYFYPTRKPHGRLAWNIFITKDDVPYIDISVMPLRRDTNISTVYRHDPMEEIE